MPRVVVPLSVANIRRLRSNLKALSRELRDEIKVGIEQETCAVIATEVKANIAGISDLDGNYLGGENPNASVTVEVSMVGHEVIWRGQQIAYLEFGTGAPGAAYPYSGKAMAEAGYHPDPTKDQWWYKDAKIGPWVSLGLVPQAPMYHASLLLRSGVILMPARAVLKGALARAVTL